MVDENVMLNSFYLEIYSDDSFNNRSLNSDCPILGDMIAEQQSIPCPEEHVLAIIIGDQGIIIANSRHVYATPVNTGSFLASQCNHWLMKTAHRKYTRNGNYRTQYHQRNLLHT